METEQELTALEESAAVLRGRITRAVEQASSGQSDGTMIPELTRELATVKDRIAVTKAQETQTERERQQQEQAQAREDLDKLILEIGEHRAEFLEAYRNANLELGLYFRALEKAGPLVRECSTAFGPLPSDVGALRDLALGTAPAEAIADLRDDAGQQWKTVFEVRPRYKKF
jgi:hypothetical protein